MRRLTYLSLFSGCGGFDLGLTRAGYQCVGAYDSDKEAIAVHKVNLGSPAEVADLSDGSLSLGSLPPIDLLAAGPPCQGFSLAGKMRVQDPRNELLPLVGHVVSMVKPKAVVVENVMGVTSEVMRDYWQRLESRLRRSGYRTEELRCNCEELGVPQRRRRMLLVGWRTEFEGTIKLDQSPGRAVEDVLPVCSSAANHDPKPLSAGTDAARIAARIGQGQKLCNVRRGPRAVHTWDIPEVFGKVTPRERRLLETLILLRRRHRRRSNGDADPVSLAVISQAVKYDPSVVVGSLLEKGYLRRLDGHLDLTHTFNGKYRRLRMDGSSPTVDTRFGQPHYFLHPVEDRGMTVREAARLQCFPDDFVFQGSPVKQYMMVGNAVPPPVGEAVGAALREVITSKEKQ